jgi:hypothetical protein
MRTDARRGETFAEPRARLFHDQVERVSESNSQDTRDDGLKNEIRRYPPAYEQQHRAMG